MGLIDNRYEIQYNRGLESKYKQRFKRLMKQGKYKKNSNLVKLVQTKKYDKAQIKIKRNVDRQTNDEDGNLENREDKENRYKECNNKGRSCANIDNDETNDNEQNSSFGELILDEDILFESYDTVIQYKVPNKQKSWTSADDSFNFEALLPEIMNSPSLIRIPSESVANEPFINYDSLKSIETIESVGTISTGNEEARYIPSINTVKFQSIRSQHQKLIRLLKYVRRKINI